MRRTVRERLLVIVMTCFCAASAAAQERQTENTVKLSPGQKPPAATIADMAWLEGHWTGEGLGGISEETWMAPQNGVMLGMYRLVRDGKPQFYELMMIREHEGSLQFRLKHFDPDLTGWEEKDQTVDFPLVARADGVLQFAGLTLRPEGDRMTMHLAIRGKDGRVREETFRYTRAAQARPVP